MISSGPIEKISWDDVVLFCNRGVKESFVLDYKADFPKDLEKTISAFANTYGGTILIGVGESDGKPNMPPSGIRYERGLAERVNQIVIDNIVSPVFPEIQVTPEKDGRTFVLIRVPQSEEAPHAILGRKHIYVRAQNITKPNDWDEFATIDQIEWLQNRRQRAKELRKLLVQKAEERAMRSGSVPNLPISFGVGKLIIAPRYPHSRLVTVQELININREISVQEYRGGDEFPSALSDAQPVQGGVMLINSKEAFNWFSYTEFNQFGLIYHLEDFGWSEKKPGADGKEISIEQLYMSQIIRRLDQALEAAGKFFVRLGFQGIVDFSFELSKILGKRFTPIQGEFPSYSRVRSIIDDSLIWDLSFTVAEISDRQNRTRLLMDLAIDIAWCFGVKNHKQLVEKFLNDNGRLG